MSDLGLWRYVEEDRGHETPCWIWQGATNADGYGVRNVGGRHRQVHRLAYEEVVGPIPEGLVLDHLCCVHACMRPDHLEPVTHAENRYRGRVRKGFPVTCRRGHRYTPENTRLAADGSRVCRACHRELARTRRARERVAA